MDHHDRNLALTNASFQMRPHDEDQSGNNPATWLPVSHWKKRRSPQSTAALAAFVCYFGGTKGADGHWDIESAWGAGWRWCHATDEHSWYPPLADVGPGVAAVLSSPGVVPALVKLDSPVDRKKWTDFLKKAENKEAEHKEAREAKREAKQAAQGGNAVKKAKK